MPLRYFLKGIRMINCAYIGFGKAPRAIISLMFYARINTMHKHLYDIA